MAAPGLRVWQSLKKCLPSTKDENIDFWWHLTGYHLAVMVEAAGYSTEKQYEVLLFHYHWIVSKIHASSDVEKRDSVKETCNSSTNTDGFYHRYPDWAQEHHAMAAPCSSRW